MTIRPEFRYKGTNILYAEEATTKRLLINTCINEAENRGFKEIQLPIIYQDKVFDKLGKMFNDTFTFKDRAGRDLILAPEYTAIIQELATTTFKNKNDVKLFYVGECFRTDTPEYGRYRQFTQFGVEILNPTQDYTDAMIRMAKNFIANFTLPIETGKYNAFIKWLLLNKEADRGIDYYTGPGFQIRCPLLEGAEQLIGGGNYENGQGFAVGIDRLMLLRKTLNDGTFEIREKEYADTVKDDATPVFGQVRDAFC